MNKLLTTGTMIDKLKAGEVAESANGGYTYKVTKSSNGGIMCLDKEGKMTGHNMPLNGDVVNEMWHIPPKYVSFDEAIKALKNGHTLRCYPEGGDDSYIEFNEADTVKDYSMSWSGLTWGEVLNAKWTIEGDK